MATTGHNFTSLLGSALAKLGLDGMVVISLNLLRTRLEEDVSHSMLSPKGRQFRPTDEVQPMLPGMLECGEEVL